MNIGDTMRQYIRMCYRAIFHSFEISMVGTSTTIP